MVTEEASAKYFAVLTRLPRWEPDFRDVLIAAGIDPFRVPAGPRQEAVEICMLLYANNGPDAKARIWHALDPFFRLHPLEDFPLPPEPCAPPGADRFAARPPLLPDRPSTLWGTPLPPPELPEALGDNG
jgi:hypothetical protein